MITAPLFIAGFLSSSPLVAWLFLLIPNALNVVFVGPLTAAVQHLVPAHKGTIESSIKDGSLVSLPLTFDFGYRTAILAYRRGTILNEATRTFVEIIRSESAALDK